MRVWRLRKNIERGPVAVDLMAFSALRGTKTRENQYKADVLLNGRGNMDDCISLLYMFGGSVHEQASGSECSILLHDTASRNLSPRQQYSFPATLKQYKLLDLGRYSHTFVQSMMAIASGPIKSTQRDRVSRYEYE